MYSEYLEPGGEKRIRKYKNVFNKYLAIVGCLHGLNRSHVPFMSSNRLRLPEKSNQSFGDAAALEKGNIHIFMATRFPCDLHLFMANCISLWQHAFFYGKHACTSLKFLRRTSCLQEKRACLSKLK